MLQVKTAGSFHAQFEAPVTQAFSPLWCVTDPPERHRSSKVLLHSAKMAINPVRCADTSAVDVAEILFSRIVCQVSRGRRSAGRGPHFRDIG
jgi:hypothetical protein